MVDDIYGLTEDRENKQGIKLSKEEIDEKTRRHIYVKWVALIKKRWENGECPKCGYLKWIVRGSGFHKKWVCDKCGLELTRADWITGQMWNDFINLHAREEIRRRKKLKGELRKYAKNEL